MKIVLAGGGTGGHFFPLIAIAEELRKIAESERIIELKLYYVSTEPYDKVALLGMCGMEPGISGDFYGSSIPV